ncbi:phage tail length tape measure family protein [Serratia marcescens]|uniref:phage tail length tape measure family protein n=1 Tax=Serratia marcescens TaxID=615 RepID=UPI003A855EBD
MATGNSSLNLALRITADMAEAKQALSSLSSGIKSSGSVAETSNGQWQSLAATQEAASEAIGQHVKTQQALNQALGDSSIQAQRAARSAEQVTAAQNAQMARGHALYQQQQKEAQAQEAAAKAAEAHGKEVSKLKKDLDNLLGSIDPASKALGKLDAQEAQLRKSHKAGLLDDGTFKEYLSKISGQRDALGQLSEGADRLSLKSRTASRELRVLIHQLAQGNIRDASNNIFDLGNRMGMLPPLFSASTLALTGVIGAIAASGYVVLSAISDQDTFNRSIQLTGNYAGVTAGQLEKMAAQGGELSSNYAQVRDILNGLVSSGKFTGDTLSSVSQAAAVMAEITGKSAAEVVSEFTKMTEGATQWAVNTNEQYHWLGGATYQRIRSLEEQGRHEEAIEAASDAYSKAGAARLEELNGKLSLVARGWKGIKEQMAEALQTAKTGVFNFPGFDTPESNLDTRISRLSEVIERNEKRKNSLAPDDQQRLKDNKETLSFLLTQKAALEANAKAETEQQKIHDKAISAAESLKLAWANNTDEISREANAIDDLKEKYRAMWADEGLRDGKGGLRDRGVTSEDGINFSGGQWDVDVKALDKTGPKVEQYNKQLQQTLNQKKQLTQLARTEAEIRDGTLQNATKEEQEKARALAKQIDAQEASNKSAKASATSAKQSMADNQRFVDSLEKQAAKRTQNAAAIRFEEIATRNLTTEQRRAAEAANAALTAQEFGAQNLQLQLQYMRSTGNTAGASLVELRNKYTELRKEFEASGNTEGLSWIDKILPVAEAKIRADELKQQMNDLFTWRSQQEQSIQAQVQGGLISELQGRQRLVETQQQAANKINEHLPKLKEMAKLPGEAGENIRELIRQLEGELGKLSETGNELTIAFRDGLQSGIESSLMGLAKGTMSLSDAVQNLALTIINSMAQIAAQQLAQMATSSLVGSSGGIGGMLGSLFAADGGHIRGPGTTTSDSIPAMLSDYEFVTRAAVVQQPGALDFLHDFNRHGMAALEGYLPRVRHATGGLAGLPAPVASAPSSVPDAPLSGTQAGTAMLQPLQQTLVFDAADAFAKGAGSVEGGRSLMTFLRANIPTLKQMLK